MPPAMAIARGLCSVEVLVLTMGGLRRSARWLLQALRDHRVVPSNGDGKGSAEEIYPGTYLRIYISPGCKDRVDVHALKDILGQNPHERAVLETVNRGIDYAHPFTDCEDERLGDIRLHRSSHFEGLRAVRAL
jgi:hypothetical protein